MICGALGCPDAELSIIVTDDAEIRELNKTYRGKDKATDVLSFSQLEEPGRRGPLKHLAPDAVLGDVVVSAETAARQAPRFGNDFEAEMTRLIVHGVVHLLGHDHVHGGVQARNMQAVERRILRAIRKS